MTKILKWRWMDKQGNIWVANQPLKWAENMRKDGYKVCLLYTSPSPRD